MAHLEHVNITVEDPDKTAAILCDLFDWHIRWQGESMGGHSVHVGTRDSYVALYAPEGRTEDRRRRYAFLGALNHIGVVVENIEDAEKKVKAAGFEPGNHADYEPGRRFYFEGPDGVEYEVVSYL